MKKEITIGILLLFLCFGCGARKVEKTKEVTEANKQETTEIKNDVVIDSNVKEEARIVFTDSTKEVIEETIIETPGKKITQRKIKRNKALKTDNNTNTLINEKTTDKTNTNTKKQEQTKKTVQAKQSEREGLIKWWWFPLIIVILFVCWKIYRKFSL
jgi:hypothetical protein